MIASASAYAQSGERQANAWRPTARNVAGKNQVHPAVARVVVPERDGISYGSGTLIHAEGDAGLVITNWHVVRDAAGHIQVLFPDGFRSVGRVVKADRDWDLAAVLIWRPQVEPVPLATAAPRPGESLAIAGYGSGDYRLATGRCIQYVSPGRNLPFEIIELSRAARQGDSGGPIFNQQGELAGVLFGAGQGTTAGSYCGRVRWFLSSVIPSQPRPESNWIAVAPERGPATAVASSQVEPREPVTAARIAVESPLREVTEPRRPAASPAAPRQSSQSSEVAPTFESARRGRIARRPIQHQPLPTPFTATGTPRDDSSTLLSSISWQAYAGQTAAEKLKTLLAVIGACAVICGGWKSFKAT